MGGGSARRVVYVTYDGLEDPLGQSQVWPYVDQLASRGHHFEIVSFEKPGTSLHYRRPLGERIRATALRYHKRPTVPATAVDMAQGLATAALAGTLTGADLIHARSYVAAAMVLPWKVAARVPLLFDTRGLWPDEKVDVGGWSADGWVYASAKKVERVLFRRADAIVVLTHSMRRYLLEEYPHRGEVKAPIHVIPTCTDLQRFSPSVPPDPSLAPQLEHARVLAYLGSLGTSYMADAMSHFYLAWRAAIRAESSASVPTRFLVITGSDPGPMRSMLESEGAGGELVTHTVSYPGVPAAVRWAEAGVSLIRPMFSKRGSAPTKIGEMLACGIPIAANAIGDLADIFRGMQAGIVLNDCSEQEIRRAATELARTARREEVRREAREMAERWFRLEDGVAAFDAIYRDVRLTR